MIAQRDLRIDFLRGIALLIVVVDHMEGWAGKPVLIHWTLISLGFSDAAEIFVFLSGYVLAVAYSKALEQGGLRACLRKSLRRSFQIYVAYVLAALTVIGIGASCLAWNPPIYHPPMRVGDRLWESIFATFTLHYHPWGFDVLAFYVVILPLMGALLYMRRRAAWLAWTISGGLYLVAQVFPAVNLPRFAHPEPWAFNPLAWQFLFFIGTYCGDPQRVRRAFAPRWLLVALSVTMLCWGLLLMKGSHYLALLDPSYQQVVGPIYMRLFKVYEVTGVKETLGPLRLAHFFALAYLTSLVLPRSLPFWSSRWARPIVISGQHSLEAYAWGLVLSFIGVFIASRGFDSTIDILLIDLVLCVGSIGFTYLVRWWQGARAVPPGRVDQVDTPEPHRVSKSRVPNAARSRGRR